MSIQEDHTIKIQTPFGEINVRATDADHVYIYANRDSPLSINRVVYRLSMHMARYGNTFEMARTEHGNNVSWCLDRLDNRDFSWAARNKVEATIPALVRSALASQQALLQDAELQSIDEQSDRINSQIDTLTREIDAKRAELMALAQKRQLASEA